VIRSSHGTGRRAMLPRRLLIAAVAALIPALAGCEAGTNAPTQQWHPPTEGTGLVQHGIDIRDMFVLGAPTNSSLAAGQSAGLQLRDHTIPEIHATLEGDAVAQAHFAFDEAMITNVTILPNDRSLQDMGKGPDARARSDRRALIDQSMRVNKRWHVALVHSRSCFTRRRRDPPMMTCLSVTVS